VFGWSIRRQHDVRARVRPGGRFSLPSMALFAVDEGSTVPVALPPRDWEEMRPFLPSRATPHAGEMRSNALLQWRNSAALQELHHEHDHRDDQQEMDEASQESASLQALRSWCSSDKGLIGSKVMRT